MPAKKAPKRMQGKTIRAATVAMENEIIDRCTTFGVPNFLVRARSTAYVEGGQLFAFHERALEDWKKDLKAAVAAMEVAKLSIGQAVMALLTVQKALLPVVANDPIISSDATSPSDGDLIAAYEIMAPLFTELPKLSIIFGPELNQQFFRAAEAFGVGIEDDSHTAELQRI